MADGMHGPDNNCDFSELEVGDLEVGKLYLVEFKDCRVSGDFIAKLSQIESPMKEITSWGNGVILRGYAVRYFHISEELQNRIEDRIAKIRFGDNPPPLNYHLGTGE